MCSTMFVAVRRGGVSLLTWPCFFLARFAHVRSTPLPSGDRFQSAVSSVALRTHTLYRFFLLMYFYPLLSWTVSCSTPPPVRDHYTVASWNTGQMSKTKNIGLHVDRIQRSFCLRSSTVMFFFSGDIGQMRRVAFTRWGCALLGTALSSNQNQSVDRSNRSTKQAQ